MRQSSKPAHTLPVTLSASTNGISWCAPCNRSTQANQGARFQHILYCRNIDPVATQTTAYKIHIPHLHPTDVTETTPAPRSRKQSMRYPDAHMWERAQNLELDKLDEAGAIKWPLKSSIPQTPSDSPQNDSTLYTRNKRGPSRA